MSTIESDFPHTDEARFADYISLLKPKVMSLVVFTGLAGMVVAPGAVDANPLLLMTALFAMALGAGAAGAFNCWYERDLDAQMKRTQNRALPKGVIDPEDALAFSIIVSVMAVTLMAFVAGPMAALLLLAANIWYTVLYTIWLKPRTVQNIVIGGASGAFPPVIGWAAVTGDVSLYPWLLFTIIFMWTPPHFWALSLFASSDYQKVGLPMMSWVRGAHATKVHILVYSILLVPVAMSPWLFGFTGAFYGLSAVALSGLFLIGAIRILREESDKAAKQLFGYSIFYLFALFLVLMIDAI